MTRLETLQKRLDLYIACEMAILEGAQSYAIGTRNLSRANLTEVRTTIGNLEREVALEKAKLSGKSRIRTIGIIPRDL